MSKSNGKIRFGMELTPEMKRIVDDLANEEGITLSELLRRSIALMKVAQEGMRDGKSVALVKDGRICERLILA